MRINKYLAESGIGSRRKVEELVKEGKVKVNGQLITNLSTDIDPNKDTVAVNGKVIRPENKVYIMLNKPPGYLTTIADEQGRKTILNLVQVKERIFPVGRLDKNSRGLLILTNDGDFADKLLHPKHKIKKVYEVKLNKVPTENQLQKFRNGLYIDGRRTAPAKIKPISSRPRLPKPTAIGTGGQVTSNASQSYGVTLTEGRKRQIRRMFEALGLKVTDLKRTQIGSLRLNTLKEGQWRFISKNELAQLQLG